MELISREQAIDALRKLREEDIEDYGCEIPEGFNQDHLDRATFAIKQLPPIQPEPHEIGYDDCANALLKMWMDNVLTDGEYYRIAGKLNVKWGKTELPEPYKGVTT